MNIGKKFKNSLLEKTWQLFEKEQKEVEYALMEAREAAFKEEIIISTQPFAELMSMNKCMEKKQYLSEEEMLKKCWKIRDFVNKKKPDNIEIRFNQMCQVYLNMKKQLNDTFVKLWVMEEEEPIYLFLKAEGQHNVMIFLGGDERQAFLVFMDDEGVTRCMQLKEFYLLSVIDDVESSKSWGILTSYSWFSAKIYTSIIQGYNLKPVVALFLSDWFRTLVEKNDKSEKLKGDNLDGKEEK